jgi:tetratricopeptide (TPR) repeat protein
MHRYAMIGSVSLKSVPALLLIALFTSMLNPHSLAASEHGSFSGRFDEIVSLRGQGEYDRAIELIRGIILECSHADEILRQAYNYLVIVVWDETGSNVAAEEAAREALLRYPDIAGDPNTFPPRLNRLYDGLREDIVTTDLKPRESGRPAASGSVLEQGYVASRFDDVASLWRQGLYTSALGEIRSIIDEYSRAEEISRRAYSYLVITVWDADGREAAVEAAREALRRHPDLEVDTLVFPPKLNSLYSEVRITMFGSLYINAEQDSCEVLLDDRFVGKTPLEIAYVPVGDHSLLLRKSGYENLMKSVDIRPGTDHRIEDVRLSRIRNWWWWTWRVGGPAAVAITSFALLGGQEEPGSDELPGPPGPPGH